MYVYVCKSIFVDQISPIKGFIVVTLVLKFKLIYVK